MLLNAEVARLAEDRVTCGFGCLNLDESGERERKVFGRGTVDGTVLIIRLIDVTAHSSVFGSSQCSQSSLILNQREGCALPGRVPLSSGLCNLTGARALPRFSLPFSADRPRPDHRGSYRNVGGFASFRSLHGFTLTHRNTGTPQQAACATGTPRGGAITYESHRSRT